MRYAVLSDVHSSLEALRAVLEVLKDKDIQATLCCGDLVGYGPDPDEVVQRISRLPNLSIVTGNHDRAAVGRMELSWFNSLAAYALRWTAERLSAESRRYLENLPERAQGPEWTIVHGSPADPIRGYLFDEADFERQMGGFPTEICFVGHTHRPALYRVPKGEKGRLQRPVPETPARLEPGERALVNPGSVGQPRDGDPRASVLIFDSEKRELTWHRVAYPIESVRRKMEREGMPEFLIERLGRGV